MKDGRIAERGSHVELLDKKGLYYDMTSVNQAKIGV